jgi:hypothetical protein
MHHPDDLGAFVNFSVNDEIIAKGKTSQFCPHLRPRNAQPRSQPYGLQFGFNYLQPTQRGLWAVQADIADNIFNIVVRLLRAADAQ